MSDRSYRQTPAQYSRHGIGGCPYLTNGLKCHFSKRDQRLPKLGQLKRSARTVEQLVAELPFQPTNLCAYPRLSDMESFSCTSETRVIGHHEEVLKLPQFHTNHLYPTNLMRDASGTPAKEASVVDGPERPKFRYSQSNKEDRYQCRRHKVVHVLEEKSSVTLPCLIDLKSRFHHIFLSAELTSVSRDLPTLGPWHRASALLRSAPFTREWSSCRSRRM